MGRDLDGRIDLILDGGPARVGLESTVLDLTGDRLRILRPGPIGAGEIRRALGGLPVDEGPAPSVPADRPAASPGQLPVHYAPSTPSVRVRPDRLAGLELKGPSALLSFGNFRPPEEPRFQLYGGFRTADEAAEGLYRLLHDWDDRGFSRIVVVLPPDEPGWRAIRDRLIRATVEVGEPRA